MSDTILVTGVSRHLGAAVARRLLELPDVHRVIGLDVIHPRDTLGGVEFVRADIRNAVVGRMLEQERVDTVVHLALSTAVTRGTARASQKEANVIGTMQLLAACQATPRLRRIVLKSTCAVYGSSAHNPALFSEDQTAPVARAGGAVRDALEVERYLWAARRRRPDLASTTLRLAPVVGPHVHSRLLDYLKLPVVPVPLGFDARLQLLHEEDAIEAIVTAATGPMVGVVNVAGDGVITVRQAVALAGRPYLALPTQSGTVASLLAKAAGSSSLEQADLDFLRYGRVLDTSAARDRLGFSPRWSTRAAFLDAAAEFPPGVPAAASVREWATALGAAVRSSVGDRRERP